jgi:hypothetical protein
MDASDADWSQLIDHVMASRQHDGAGAAITLWKSLADQLLPLIGDGGFSALYTRSIYLTQLAFNWFTPGSESDSIDILLSDLTIFLELRSHAEVSQASHMLLLKFITSLASLIGTSLTLLILRSAWRIDAAGFAQAPKELPHD